MKTYLVLLIALLVGPLAIAPQSTYGADTFTNAWWKVAFDTPVLFTPPQEIGLDAASLLHPPGSGLGKALMEIVLIAVPKEMQGAFSNNDTEILEYVKTTFLALNGPAKAQVHQTFFGKKTAGELYSTTIAKNKSIEVYLLSLADGDKLALAFLKDSTMTEDAAKKVGALVAATLKEVPARQ